MSIWFFTLLPCGCMILTDFFLPWISIPTLFWLYLCKRVFDVKEYMSGQKSGSYICLQIMFALVYCMKDLHLPLMMWIATCFYSREGGTGDLAICYSLWIPNKWCGLFHVLILWLLLFHFILGWITNDVMFIY